MKKVLKSVLIATIAIVICTALIGCRRKNNDDTSSGGMMSDINSVASDVMSNVESGMQGIVDPSSGSNNSQTASNSASNN